MKTVEAIKLLHERDSRCNRYLYRSRELGMLFDEKGNTLRSTIKRLLSEGVLSRVARDGYFYEFSHPRDSVIGRIAVFLRPGELTYESLESAASQWGVISQIPLDRIMCVTGGAAGEVRTRFGVIDYEHTDEGASLIVDEIADREPRNALPIASKERCISDLLKYGRSVELIDWEEVNDGGRF